MSPQSRRRWILHTAAALAVVAASAPLQAQRATLVELVQLHAKKTEDGLTLSYQVRFDLPREVEDALMKGIAIVFVARAEVFASRWYWTDKSKGNVERRWRLVYHPLSRHWRVSFDGLSQSYNSLNEALGVIQRNSNWRLLDNAMVQDEDAHYLAFSFELDRNELPRPLQIGLSDQSEWSLKAAGRIALPR